MDTLRFLNSLRSDVNYDGQIVHIQDIPPREAKFADPKGGVNPRLQRVLKQLGIEQLYLHQAEAIDAIRAGKNVVVVTSAASGKTLCYNIPVIEETLDAPSTTALFIYPTKALAQDQLRRLNNLKEIDPLFTFTAGTYDGDTPTELRRKLRDRGNIILTNPDMLHQGIMPHHFRWSKFFTNLEFVVIDEVHTYRGVFGSNVANVIRRLNRVCAHYESKPVYICSSATIHNPKELAERITGREMELVANDGSPQGAKKFILWNPPLLDSGAIDRRSANTEAVRIMTKLIEDRIQTITFVRTRQGTELIFRYCQESLQRFGPKLANSVHAYRGGYLPEERREIERRLASGDLLGVTSTNALELGIDIGSLDACLIVGYPGTIASTWQQAGRAGRGTEESIVFMIALNSPIDQYLMRNPYYLFEQSPENAVIDPDNPYISLGHLQSAIYELPLLPKEMELFGLYTAHLLDILEEQSSAKERNGRWYWVDRENDYPAKEVNLRNVCSIIYTIQDVSKEDRIIGTMDEISAFSQVHTHAVYIHEAETYFVLELDVEKKIAFVERRGVDYYTQSITKDSIRVDDTEDGHRWRVSHIYTGDVTVTSVTVMFKKIKFQTRESIGFENLDLPPQTLETVAFWLIPPGFIFQRIKENGRVAVEGLIGVANVIVEVIPIFVMCDSMDIGAVVDSSNTGAPSLFVFDRYPGGLGFAQKAYQQIEDIVQGTLKMIEQCPCHQGCPSCVGSAIPPFAQTDLDSGTRDRIPDKEAALIILHDLLELEPYIPKYPPIDENVAIAAASAKLEAAQKSEIAARAKKNGKRMPLNLEQKMRKRAGARSEETNR